MTCSRGRSRAASWVVGVLFVAALSAASGRWAAAQDGGWSRPELIYETAESIDTPFLAAGANGVTHLFWRESRRDTSDPDVQLEAIFYANDRDGVWSQGRDVIAMSGLGGPAAAVDSEGVVQLIWHGPNNALFHSLAGTESARSAQGWVEPVTIATANVNAHVVVGEDRATHVVFPGTDASGVYYVRYDVAADVWTSPVAVSATAANTSSADYARLAIGPDGTLHVVWTEFLLPQGWPPMGIYYAQSTDDGATWSRATELAGENNVQANIAVDSAGRVHVAWNGVVGVGGRYHQWSDDGGLTWSPVADVVAAGQGGTEGPPQLAIDSADTLHLLSTFSGCAHHAAWRDGAWTEPVCISGREAMAGGYIEQPALTVTNGNELHAVFWDDRARLWHTSLTTDAPFVAPVVPMQAAPPAVGPQEGTPMAVPEATPRPTFDLSAAPPAPGGMLASPARALLPASAAAAALLALILLIKMIRSR